VHPKLAAVAIEHSGAGGGPIEVEQPLDLSELTREERARLRELIFDMEARRRSTEAECH
jgi:hypothetical protein